MDSTKLIIGEYYTTTWAVDRKAIMKMEFPLLRSNPHLIKHNNLIKFVHEVSSVQKGTRGYGCTGPEMDWNSSTPEEIELWNNEYSTNPLIFN